VADPLYRIGELARLTGVSVKTIRYYSDLGLLPPAAVRASGYRLYSDDDRARLALVRTLRDVGVDLASIRRLLESDAGAAETLAVQLDAVELGIRTLRRRRAVLRAALARGGDTLGAVERLRALAGLDALERRQLLGRWLDRTLDGIPVSERFAAELRALVTVDVPDDPTDAQLEAWIELAELVSDEAFVSRLREIGEASWQGVRREAMTDAWYAERRALEGRALGLADAGADPAGVEGREISDAYVALHARAAGRAADAAFACELLARIDAAAEPRAERFWQLVAVLKGWERPHDLPTTRAHRWLFAALRAAYPA
jgi:DNA-binding transcriptional MerR regulator